MPKKLFQKGNPGKQPGTKNKLTRSFKELLLDVLDKIQDHPTANLESFAEKNPKEFYQIASKLIPTELEAKVKNSGTIVVRRE